MIKAVVTAVIPVVVVVIVAVAIIIGAVLVLISMDCMCSQIFYWKEKKCQPTKQKPFACKVIAAYTQCRRVKTNAS